jgi:hypothetical protein
MHRAAPAKRQEWRRFSRCRPAGGYFAAGTGIVSAM